MTDKEKIHQILSSLWKSGDNGVGKTYYNQALQDVQTAIDLQEEPISEELEKKNKIEILADIIFNAAKHGYMPYDTQDEYCAMEIARKNIDKFIVPKKQEEPVSNPIDFEQELYKAFRQVKDFTLGMRIAKRFYNMGMNSQEPVSEDLEEAAELYTLDDSIKPWRNLTKEAFKAGAQWHKANPWKLADGDELPEIDREVIALLDNGKVVFAHRPPEYCDGKDIVTGKVTRNYPKTYDKGGWNIPNIKYWLDVELPKEMGL